MTPTEFATRLRNEKAEYLREVKAEAGCANCPETDPVVLHFHHRDPSTKTAKNRRGWLSMGWDRIKVEVAKCDVLCANCHLRHHYGGR